MNLGRNMIHMALPLLLAGILLNTASAQGFLEKQTSEEEKVKYDPEKVVDTVYGIEMYRPLNKWLKGDSVRNCGDYACDSWVKDHYKNGQLLHKGYYVEGQLKLYKNFYPDGTLEREFEPKTTVRSRLKKYYPSGDLKSEVIYLGKVAKEWTDYYRNGQVKYHEKYDDGINYYLKKASYQKDGTPKEVFKITDEDELRFVKKKYHENGELKMKGKLYYSERIFEMKKTGTWKYYDEGGELIKEETYVEGDLQATKEH